MQNFLLIFISVMVVSFTSFSQMKLQLPQEITGEEEFTNLKLVINESGKNFSSSELTDTPDDALSMIPGTFLIGLLGDVTFPFGEAFKNYAGTAWSIHAMGGYVLDPIMLSLKVGYIRFGEVETDFSLLEKSSQFETITAYNTQLIFALAAAFLLSNLGTACPAPSCLTSISQAGLQPYIAIGICLILKNYFQVTAYNFGANKIAKTAQIGDEFEESSTIFGITPSIGTFYQVSNDVRLIFSLDYYYLFDEADIDASNINYLSITFGGAYSLK